MLQFNKFQKSYGDFAALAIEDFRLDCGIYWVRGMNGSGKSTLLKAIAGILSFEGDILLDQINIKKEPVRYRQVVNFAEAEPLYPEFLTGTEMINLFASAKNAPAKQASYYIESMQMRSFIGKPIGVYSSGMLKKLSLVLAFLGNPRLILLDEPLITLDTEALQILYEWIIEKSKQHSTGFLLSSHQQVDQQLLSFAQHILVDKQTICIGS